MRDVFIEAGVFVGLLENKRSIDVFLEDGDDLLIGNGSCLFLCKYRLGVKVRREKS